MVQPGDRFGDFSLTAVTETTRAGAVIASAVQNSTQKEVRLLIFQSEHPGLQDAARVRSRAPDSRILDVVGAGSTRLPWIAYEKPEGRTLGDLVRSNGPLSVAATRELFGELFDAVARLHAAGIVHGALEPDAIWIVHHVGRPMTVKIGNAALGTVIPPESPWLAPEGVKSPRSDVFVLGNLAFFCLVGRIGPHVPLPASATARALQAPISFERSFDTWFARCTEENTSFRFTDATEARTPLLLALEDMERRRIEPAFAGPVDAHPYRSPPAVPLASVPRRSSSMLPIIFAAAGLLVGTTAMGIFLVRPDVKPRPPAARANTSMAPHPVAAAQQGLQPTLTIPAHMSAVFGVALLPRSDVVISTSFDDTLKGWELGSGAQKFALSPSFGKGGALAVGDDGLIAAGGTSGKVKLWMADAPPKLTAEIAAHGSQVSGLAIAASAPVMVSCSLDGSVKAWRLPSGELLSEMRGHSGRVMSVAASSDGERAISSGDDGTVRVWSIKTGQSLQVIRAHERPISSVRLASDGQTIATASDDGSAKLFHADSGALLRTFAVGPTEAWAVAFTPSGRTLAVGAKDASVTLYSVFSGERLRTLRGHTSGVISLAFDSTNTTLVSAGGDGTLRVWKNL